MTGLKDLPFLGETGHVISLVGGGGKTTLLYALARHYSEHFRSLCHLR